MRKTKRLACRIPENDSEIQALAASLSQPLSTIIRQALYEFVQRAQASESWYTLATRYKVLSKTRDKKLPRDLSITKAHFEGFGS